MGNLSAFLAQNAIQADNIQYIASRRFIGEDGQPMQWDIACITSSEDEALRTGCTKRVPVPGKRGQFTPEIDYNSYLGKLAAKCTVFPNLNDAELQNSYGVMGADALLKAMLTPGEYAQYMAKVQEVNGFDLSFDDKVEEAKN